MLVIRAEQMHEMNGTIFRAYIVKMREKLKADFSERLESMEHGAIEDLILKSIKLAEEYGVDKESDVEKFIECVVKYGLDFDKTCPWAQKILSDRNMDGTDKMIQLEIQAPS